MRNRPLIAFLVAGAAALAVAGPASANTSQISLMQDDDLLLYRGPDVQASTMERMYGLGVDQVRINMIWRNVVGKGARKVKRSPTNPASYPAGNWDPYDALMRLAAQYGMGVHVTVTGPVPDFAEGKNPPRTKTDAQVWKPNPSMYNKFVQAVGKRYSGGYVDENEGNVLPPITAWALWNEPNQAGWLQPQYQKHRLASPALYKSLFFAGDRALKKTGHGGDQIFLGETAPLGSRSKGTKSPVGPAPFLNSLFRGSKRFPVTGYAHHPYTKRNPPNVPDRSPGAITLANIGVLESILDRSGNVSAGLPILSTEFGYESNPPDPFNGIPQDTQAEWINEGDFIMYNDPRIIGNTQFLLRDAPGDSRFSPKPAAQAYALPLWVTSAGGDGSAVNVWGQLRFRPNGSASDAVQLQFRAQGSDAWTDSGPPLAVSDPLGYFSTQAAAPFPAVWRAVWTSADKSLALSSREALPAA